MGVESGLSPGAARSDLVKYFRETFPYAISCSPRRGPPPCFISCSRRLRPPSCFISCLETVVGNRVIEGIWILEEMSVNTLQAFLDT